MIGKRIKEARKARGCSAEEVAEYLGVSPATIYRYENGSIAKIPMKHVLPLALYLKVSPAYLLGVDDKDKQNIIKEDEHSIEECLEKNIIVLPDNQKFLEAYDVMPYEDRLALMEIFKRAYEKIKK